MPRKNSRTVTSIVLREDRKTPERLALPRNQRHLSFGDKWAYAPAPEAHTHIPLKKRYELYIGGKFPPPKSELHFPPINRPADERQAEILAASRSDVDKEVKAARRA